MSAATLEDDLDTCAAPPVAFSMPPLRGIGRRATPSLIEGSLVPYLVLAGGLHLSGLRFGLLAALAWTLAAVGLRAARRRRVSGLLVLSTCTLTARTLFAVVTGDTLVYFLQPVVVTLLVGLIFFASAFTARPLAWRLANDFCPVPGHLLGDLHVGRYFRRLSLGWAGVNVTKAAVTIWMFERVPFAQFVMLKGVLSLVLVGGAVVASVVSFRYAMARFEADAPTPIPMPVLI